MKKNWKTVPNLILIFIFLGTAVPTLTLPLTGEWDFDKIEKNGEQVDTKLAGRSYVKFSLFSLSGSNGCNRFSFIYVPYLFFGTLFIPQYETLMASPTLQDIFSVPVAPDLATIWMLGFSLPFIIYFVSSHYAAVINFFNHKNEDY